MSTYTLVTTDNYHTIITDYIKANDISISDYDDMKECIIRMIKDLHCFNFDKNLLRGFMEDLTFMYNSSDEKNKDRIINMLDESDDDSDDDDDDDATGNPMENMMQMLMGGMMQQQQQGTEQGAEQGGEAEESTENVESTNVD